MGHAHFHRPFVSRRDFLRRSAAAAGVAAAGPWFWRQLAYAADTPVAHRHVTFGADAAREMVVSWMTPGPVTSPFVELAGRRVDAATQQYAGYPGYFHHAAVTQLDPATAYDYRVGHAGAAVGGAATLRTGPADRTPFSFTAFGDQGTDGGSAQPPNQPSANTELARSMKPALHLIVGDLAYANGDQAVWDDWFTMIEPMASGTPWMPCIGNHEIEDQLDPAAAGGGWGKWGYDPYRTRFSLPGNGHDELANCFYAFRYGGVAFVSIDNNDVNAEITNNVGYTGGRQKAWVEQTLAAASADPEVDFIVVLMHQCAFSSSTKHGSDEGVQKTWFELFARHSVDLVLQGHDHTYERTHAMHGADVADGDAPYSLDAGTIYVVCGNGGAVQEPFQPVQPAWSAHRQALKVGTLKIDVDPLTPAGTSRLTLGEYWALDGSPIEEGIVLEKRARVAAASAHGAPVAATTDVSTAPPTSTRPDVTLPATGGPAGIEVVGVAAAGAGLALRHLVREEGRELARAREIS